ncbi:MAG: alpha/beta hydrolase [Longimicrobiales bacterium]
MNGGDRAAEDGAGETAVGDALEHRIAVPRSARYYTLGAAGSHVRQVWLVCHGYGHLALPFLRAFDAIADAARLVVAPEALNRYYTDGGVRPHGPDSPVGATWMTREDRLAEIDDYVRYLDLVYADALRGIDRGRVSIFALGFSQGAATVARWAARTAFKLDHVVLWGGILPPELEPAPRLFASADLTFAFGSRDAFASAERIREEQERLRAAGLAFRILRFDGGHRLDAETLRQLALVTP